MIKRGRALPRMIGAGIMLAIMVVLPARVAVAAEAAPIQSYLQRALFTDMKISPDGRYLAASVPRDDDMTGLVVIDFDSMKPSASVGLPRDHHVFSFDWVNDTRLLISVAKKEGVLDQPIPTGELYAVNADGSGSGVLFGYRAGSGSGGRVGRSAERASGFPLHMMPDSENQVLIKVDPWGSTEGGLMEVRRLNTLSGRTSTVVRAVQRRADFLVDRQGNVRLTWGESDTNKRQVHHRPASGGRWELLHDEDQVGYAIIPRAFDVDGRHVLVEREHAEGSSGIYRLDLETGESELVYRHPVADPVMYLPGIEVGSRYGVIVVPGLPELGLLDSGDTREARLAQAIRDAFPGQVAYITSFTRDGSRALVRTMSDHNPGEFFMFEPETMSAAYVASVRETLTPEQLGEMRPVSLTARDGTPLHGYLQLPPGAGDPRALPMVVNPHGGPHGVRDLWGFNEEAQLLASRGYAVLKINFRGSGGYGIAFERAGYRQWGGTMQDDIADAVRWAIAQGYADKDRICIYGGSFGGYSALMSAVRYPELYQCTIGYVGVYDLELMYRDGDIRRALFGRNYLQEVLGRGEVLKQFSPITFADQIKMPVFLIHGGQDQRVPISHANRLRSALRAAGNEPEWLVERTEGHGFYRMDNRVKLYTQLLDFLDRHIGPSARPAAQAASSGATDAVD